MKPTDFPRARMASGASLGALLILLDLRPETVEERCGSEALSTAIERCLACPTHAACGRWLGDHERRWDSWRGFCPNAAMLGQAQPGFRRGR